MTKYKIIFAILVLFVIISGYFYYQNINNQLNASVIASEEALPGYF